MSSIYRTVILKCFFLVFIFYSLFVENLWKAIKTTNNLMISPKMQNVCYGRENLGDGRREVQWREVQLCQFPRGTQLRDTALN